MARVLQCQAGASGHPRLHTYSMNLARASRDDLLPRLPIGVGSEEAMPGRPFLLLAPGTACRALTSSSPVLTPAPSCCGEEGGLRGNRFAKAQPGRTSQGAVGAGLVNTLGRSLWEQQCVIQGHASSRLLPLPHASPNHDTISIPSLGPSRATEPINLTTIPPLTSHPLHQHHPHRCSTIP